MSAKNSHHGGSWKVAYADFVTAMMALFLCLWLTSQDQKIKDAVERAFKNPFSSVTKESVGIIPNKDASSTYKQEGRFSSVSAVEMETMRRLSEDLAKLLKQQDEDQSTVQINLTPEGLQINIFDRSRKPVFKPDSDAFTDYGAWVFGTLAWEISRYPTFHIELEGHTETNASTGREGHSKWEVSTERANTARRKLVQNGVSPVQIFKVSGYADTQPMPGCAPEDEINRRVTVMLKLKESVDALPADSSSDTSP
ncbi:MAG TPA: flagellar motor protein MotB [Elusimicrobiota bacterium]|nr:flagellar motor protein MotB [Elusimicrobiota bacterium]